MDTHVPLKTRKRKINKNAWKVNAAKNVKNCGSVGISKRNKIIKKRSMGLPCTCRVKCRNKINEAQRQILFDNFWSLSDHTRQWDYLARKIVVITPKERKITLSENVEPRKKNSFTYYLNVNDRAITVCRTMFISTFGT